MDEQIERNGKTYRKLEVGEVLQDGDLWIFKSEKDMRMMFPMVYDEDKVGTDDDCHYYREVQPEAKPETPAPINDGGPAFPLQDWDECIHSRRTETGMTLRDWFAGQALTTCTLADDKVQAEWVSARCYEFADAMLKARKEVHHGHSN
jgi:hypothetical protein